MHCRWLDPDCGQHRPGAEGETWSQTCPQGLTMCSTGPTIAHVVTRIVKHTFFMLRIPYCQLFHKWVENLPPMSPLWNNGPALVDSSQPQCARHTSSTKSRYRPCIRPRCCAACCQAFPIFLCIRLHNNNSFLIKCTTQ